MSISINQFVEASRAGKFGSVLHLLKNGVDVNGEDTFGRTALMAASDGGHMEVVKLLLDNGADVNLQSNRGDTTFIGAEDHGDCEIIKFLLGDSADVYLQRTFNRNTALIIASRNGFTEIVKLLLLENGADMTITAKDGKTAKDWALEKGHIDIVNILNEVRMDCLILQFR